MTEEKYKKLNSYLNEVFIELEKRDKFLIKNILNIGWLNEQFLKYINNKDLSVIIKQNNLTFEDIFLLAREIIESIDENYLPDYDNLIKTGEIEFFYNNEINDSRCAFYHRNNMCTLDINRNFTYDDAISTVHEYMHRTNMKNIDSENRYLLTEFISIYFEIYTEKYMIEQKQIPKDEVANNFRLMGTKRSSYNFNSYYLELSLFYSEGNLDSESYKNSILTKEEYESECLKMLEDFEQIEKEYNFEILYEKEYDNDELRTKFASKFTSNYRYILGFLLAVYALKYSDVEKIKKLNEYITDRKHEDLGIIELLKMIDINLNEDHFYDELFNCLDEYVEKYQNVKNR